MNQEKEIEVVEVGWPICAILAVIALIVIAISLVRISEQLDRLLPAVHERGRSSTG